MNAVLEFHDSKIASVRAVSGDVRLALSSAYIHRSAGRPAIDPGSVFLQPAELVFSSAVYSESGGPCIGAISDASVTVDGDEYSNVVPVPFMASGSVSGLFTFSSGGILRVSGRGVSCQVSGSPVFVEAYDG